MSVHDPEEIARFLDSEPRLVYARYRSEPTSRFFLEDGRGGEEGLREWVATELECPMPECGDRRLSLVHRSGSVKPRRDGFKHYAGAGGHAPESIWHSNAKEVVRRWAQTMCGDYGTVQVEARLGKGERIADVLVQWPVNRVAFEIQYAALSVAEWRERHEWYVREGIKDVWLWGHTGHHLKLDTEVTADAPALFKLGEVQRAVIADGERAVHWINPLTEQFASAFVRRTHQDHPDLHWDTIPSADDELVALAVEPMTVPTDRREGHSLSTRGLLTGAWREHNLNWKLFGLGVHPSTLGNSQSS